METVETDGLPCISYSQTCEQETQRWAVVQEVWE